MTAEQFRKLALSLPEAAEQSHRGHPDFRVHGKIFATLGYPDEEWAMVKLSRDQQQQWVEAEPKIFRPVKGEWGLRGSTNVLLKPATRGKIQPALEAAWRNVAPDLSQRAL